MEAAGVGDIIGENLPEGAVLGSHIILAEVLTQDDISLVIDVSEGIQPWTLLGMLQYAYENVLGQLEESGAFEDEAFEGYDDGTEEDWFDV